jgi:hypothetical protein
LYERNLTSLSSLFLAKVTYKAAQRFDIIIQLGLGFYMAVVWSERHSVLAIIACPDGSTVAIVYSEISWGCIESFLFQDTIGFAQQRTPTHCRSACQSVDRAGRRSLTGRSQPAPAVLLVIKLTSTTRSVSYCKCRVRSSVHYAHSTVQNATPTNNHLGNRQESEQLPTSMMTYYIEL